MSTITAANRPNYSDQNYINIDFTFLPDFLFHTFRIKMLQEYIAFLNLRSSCTVLLYWYYKLLFFVGYGHVTPLSEGGKIFCMVYALIGIPLTLIMFTALVERLMIVTSKFLRFMQDKLGHLYKSLQIRLMHLSIILLILIVFIFLIPAGILTVLEDDWNYLDAIYYCFISLTTIGLGDYIPGDNPKQQQRALYKICTTGKIFSFNITSLLATIIFCTNKMES